MNGGLIAHHFFLYSGCQGDHQKNKFGSIRKLVYLCGMLKHKGDKVTPTNVYHKSNPIFRQEIEGVGLMVMKGDSYGCHSPEDTEPPAIFGKTDDTYDSTYDDDVWLIDCSMIDNEWFEDKECGGGCVVTYQNIPRYALILIYKGTGNSF